jgi:hypothetical protein
MDVIRNAHKILVRKFQRKKPLERHGITGRVISKWGLDSNMSH